ncbi:MAG: hypothetical protein C4547_07090 [Phycisphaerales bacterium]|nr:MAG: hypothetical protein C4547_07090 [Phycisphaerales bacterium]
MTQGIATLLSLVALLACGSTVRAEIIRVPGDYPTISEAIAAASDGDTVLIADGIYTGAANKNLSWQGKSLVVRSENGPDRCVIDCEDNGACFAFRRESSTTATIEGLTLTRGNGGAITSRDNTRLTVRNCIVTKNRSHASAPGGGISAYGTVDIVDCKITDNLGGYGGGVAVYGGPATISSCEITGNRADRIGGANTGLGGGVFVSFDTTIINCVIRGNAAIGSGGGVYAQGKNVAIWNSIIENNTGRSNGGVVMIGGRLERSVVANNLAEGGGGVSAGYDAVIRDCVIADNRATVHGAGGLHLGTRSSVFQTVVVSNTAAAEGGGIYSYSGDSIMQNLIVYGNTAQRGGGLFVLAGSPQMSSSIVRANVADEHPEIAGTPLVIYSDIEGGFEGEGNIDRDPNFTDPERGDFHLTAGSPCIDAGDNVTQFARLTTDFDGLIRRFDDPDTPDTGRGRGPITDMGAYEFAAPLACTGDERLTARCREENGTFAIDIKTRRAQPGATLTFVLDANDESAQLDRVNRRGRAKLTFVEVDAGGHAVELLECGLRRNVACR